MQWMFCAQAYVLVLMMKTITFAILTGMISEIMTILLNWRNP